MTLSNVISYAIQPALELLPAKMASTQAIVMLLAIGLQESRFEHRKQIRGPARGFWQFEAAGLRGIRTHRATRRHVDVLAEDLSLGPDWRVEALRWNDVLAAGCARLLLWSHPLRLPQIEYDAWVYYRATWRPGSPHRATWRECWDRANDMVEAL